MPRIEPSFTTLNADAVTDTDIRAFVAGFGGVYALWVMSVQIERVDYRASGDHHETSDAELR